MKIKISRETMLKALQKVGNIVNTRNTLPVLSNILFEANEGKLKLTGTDLEIRMETVVDAEVIEAGVTTLCGYRHSPLFLFSDLPDVLQQIPQRRRKTGRPKWK